MFVGVLSEDGALGNWSGDKGGGVNRFQDLGSLDIFLHTFSLPKEMEDFLYGNLRCRE